jgi:hypothetical protein
MAWYLCTIAASSKGNWQKCIDSGMWGIATSADNTRIDPAREGDELLFWLAGSGYCGYAKVLENTRKPKDSSETPWLGGMSRYSLVVPMKVVREFKTPLKMKFANGKQELTGILQPYFQRGYMPISDDSAQSVIDLAKELEI